MRNKILIATALLTSGVLLGVFFCNYTFFEFEKTIKITDIVSLGITSFLGFYIATNVNKVFTKNNSEKEFLIDEVKAVLKIVNKILSAVNERNLPFNPTKSNFKNINENLVLLEKLLASSHCKNIKLDDLRTNLYSLRNLVTSISPTNGNIILTNVNFNPIKISAANLKAKFYNLIFEINKA